VRDIFINVRKSSCKIPTVIITFQQHMDFLDTFSKNPEISNFMKIRPVGAELFLAGRRTDRHDEANSRLSLFFGRA
jgi:hypothetical protein